MRIFSVKTIWEFPGTILISNTLEYRGTPWYVTRDCASVNSLHQSVKVLLRYKALLLISLGSKNNTPILAFSLINSKFFLPY